MTLLPFSSNVLLILFDRHCSILTLNVKLEKIILWATFRCWSGSRSWRTFGYGT